MRESFTTGACAFAGHRPARFLFGFNESDERCRRIKKLMREQVRALVADGVTDFYTGMALGVDQWAAKIVLAIRSEHPGIRLIAVLPCETQPDSWSVPQRAWYFDALAICDDVITLHTRYTQSCMFERNRYLVDHAGHLLAVCDGGTKGGTAYTVNYAKRKQRQVTVIHPDTLTVTSV